MSDTSVPVQPIPRSKGLAEHYHAGLRAREIRLQSCDSCAMVWHYPRPVCPGCGGAAFTWVVASGAGRIHSFTVIHHTAQPALKAAVPYVAALVDLAEGARIAGIIVGSAPNEVAIDDPVIAEFPVSQDGEAGLPVFRKDSP